jgi:predicted acetyltransferase
LPQLSIYPSNRDLPPHLACQIHSFIRITWFDIFQYDLSGSVTPEAWHPAHVVLAEQHVVLSYAGVVWQHVQHGGETYKTYGLSGVFTYPAFRKKGCGRRVVDSATARIRQQDGDFALLFTDPELEGFYAASGWEHMPSTTILTGSKQQPEVYTPFNMMLFLSEKGRQLRAHLEREPLYFAEYAW